jgi:hypothetical protein
MDFRHVAWLWLPLTVLQAQALNRFPSWPNRVGQRLALAVILLGIMVQWALIVSL